MVVECSRLRMGHSIFDNFLCGVSVRSTGLIVVEVQISFAHALKHLYCIISQNIEARLVVSISTAAFHTTLRQDL